MSEKPPLYIFTSREHKKNAWVDGWGSRGWRAGSVGMPQFTGEPDELSGEEFAIAKLLGFAGSGFLTKMISDEIAYLAAVDMAARVQLRDGQSWQMTTARGVAVARDKFEETGKALLAAQSRKNGRVPIFWENTTGVGRWERGSETIGEPFGVVASATLWLNEKLIRRIESGRWYYTVATMEQIRGERMKLRNPASSGAMNWPNVMHYLDRGEYMVWQRDGKEWVATAGKEPTGMKDDMETFLRGVPDSTFAQIEARLT
jgi:hypothetical protein